MIVYARKWFWIRKSNLRWMTAAAAVTVTVTAAAATGMHFTSAIGHLFVRLQTTFII